MIKDKVNTSVLVTLSPCVAHNFLSISLHENSTLQKKVRLISFWIVCKSVVELNSKVWNNLRFSAFITEDISDGRVQHGIILDGNSVIATCNMEYKATDCICCV